MSARGHIRRRGTNSWELKFDASEASGKRVTRYVSFRGTRKAAQAKLASLIVATENGTFVEPAKVTVGQFVSDRVDQWEAAGSITARTASRYRDLVRCQIIPFIGTKQIQKLTTLDIEQWHGTLKTSGRANGKGGLAARSIGHCHRLLRAALRDSTKHGLTVKNVALAQSAYF